jgi:release factor glutamine methyltransferase
VSARAVEEAARILAAAGVDAAELESLRGAASGNDERLVASARQRAAGVPLGLLTGTQIFLGIELSTAPGVLVPRTETELVGRAAIEALRRVGEAGGEPLFADVCCGSGNLACAIACHVPSARGWACDLTGPAVELARRNVERLRLSGRVEVRQGDLLSPLADSGLEGRLDAIVCNPPYISTGKLERDRASLLAHEPREAFDGGPYGLTIHQRLVREAARYLGPGAPLLLEVGQGQVAQVVLLLKRSGMWDEPETRNDAAGSPRAILARRKVG